ncbi:MAG: zinc ribbon domain-containing protein [Mogibacterium sp.]|nr:zinc ribbon domain-containing protein [Mogibacterium sp.]
MFCSKCGNQLAEGAYFCSVCGARVDQLTEHPVQGSTLQGSFFEEEPAVENRVRNFDLALDWGEEERPKTSDTRMSFDWSSVIDEGRKKVNRDIRSPWDMPEESPADKAVTPEEERAFEQSIFSDMNESRPDRSRTMTFIDILKQEREAKARQAEDAAKSLTGEPELEPMDLFPAQEPILPKEEREVTKGYTDLKRDIIAEMEKRESGSDFTEQLNAIRSRREQREEVVAPEPPQTFVLDPEEEFEKLLKRTPSEEVKIQPEAKAPITSDEELEAELAAILGLEVPKAAEAPEPEEEAVLLEPEEIPAEEAEEREPETAEAPQAEDEYAEYLDYVPRTRVERQSYEEEDLTEEEPEDLEVEIEEELEVPEVAEVAAEPEVPEVVEVAAEPEIPAAEAEAEPEVLEIELEEAPEVPEAEPVVSEPEAVAPETAEPEAEPAAEEPAYSVEDEIAALKKRLAELMGQKEVTVAPVPEEVPVIEEVAEVLEEIPAVEEVVEVVEEIPAAEEVVEVVEEIPAVEEVAEASEEAPAAETVAEEPAEEAVFDIPSVEEIFPAEEPEEEPIPEPELPAEESIEDQYLTDDEDIFNVELRNLGDEDEDELPEETEEDDLFGEDIPSIRLVFDEPETELEDDIDELIEEVEAPEVPEVIEEIEVPEVIEEIEVPEVVEEIEVPEAVEEIEVPEVVEEIEVPEAAEEEAEDQMVSELDEALEKLQKMTEEYAPEESPDVDLDLYLQDYETPVREGRRAAAAEYEDEEAFDEADEAVIPEDELEIPEIEDAEAELEIEEIEEELPAAEEEIAEEEEELPVIPEAEPEVPEAEAAVEVEETEEIEESVPEIRLEFTEPEEVLPEIEPEQPEAEEVLPEIEPELPEVEVLPEIEPELPEVEEVLSEKPASGEDAVIIDDPEIDLDRELEDLGFTLAEEAPAKTVVPEEEIFFTPDTTDVSTDTIQMDRLELEEEAGPMTIEDLEKDLFGEVIEDTDLEATRKIEKFYTLYRKNEEFQKLLDAEYDKLQGNHLKDDVTEESMEQVAEAIESRAEALEAIPESVLEELPAEAAEEPVVRIAEAVAEDKSGAGRAVAAAATGAAVVTVAEQAAQKQEKAAAEKAAEAAEEDEVKGGGILTAIAIIIAILLIVLLAIILILNFAPDSALAAKLNELIGSFTNFAAVTDGSEWLV